MATNEEASPICRGKNLSWETVMLFFNYMPKEPMPKNKFNSYVEENINSWTQTHSQIARQLAFYYEEDGVCYPRFNEASTLEDLFSYMIHWAHNYFVPNPFAPSLKGKTPTSIYSHLVKCIDNGVTDFDEALDSLFDIPLSSHDKVKVYLQNYSNIKIDQGVISLNKKLIDTSTIIEPSEDVATDPKLYFLFFSKENSGESRQEKKCIAHQSLQQIYYGAPGTGKSHTINELTEGESVIRTTFHPDSDYSTFVGAYKPTMGLLPICDELGQPMKIGSTALHKEQIIYEFVDQAFLQAYVQAWKYYAENSDDAKRQYLVIEEINRGNCAQIFGDLFQLLDRNDSGFSVYPINADKDMKKQLAKAFKKDGKTITIEDADKINALYKGKDVVSQVLSGDILLLPDNLYIWATMNTSDQSLFPIDSAFKRRWEWQYMPIDKGYDANGQEIKWAIEGLTKKYDWWSFLDKINAQIGEATQSEDKKLGFFFCKASDGVISAEKFVGKVIFYLWNDVFKNNGFEGPIFKDVDGTELSFSKFYKSDSKGNAIVQKDKVEVFLNNLGVEKDSDIDEAGEAPEEAEDVTDATVLSTTKQLRKAYWDAFIKYANQTNSEYAKYFGGRKTPSTDKWYNFFFGVKDCHLCVEQTRTRKELSVGLYFDETTDNFFKLRNSKEAIEAELGMTFNWKELPDKKASYIVHIENNIDFEASDRESTQFDYIIEKLLSMRKVFLNYLQ